MEILKVENLTKIYGKVSVDSDADGTRFKIKYFTL